MRRTGPVKRKTRACAMMPIVPRKTAADRVLNRMLLRFHNFSISSAERPVLFAMMSRDTLCRFRLWATRRFPSANPSANPSAFPSALPSALPNRKSKRAQAEGRRLKTDKREARTGGARGFGKVRAAGLSAGKDGFLKEGAELVEERELVFRHGQFVDDVREVRAFRDVEQP